MPKTVVNRLLPALFAVLLCTSVLAQEHHNRAIVETAYANFARGDVAAFLDILDPGVIWVAALRCRLPTCGNSWMAKSSASAPTPTVHPGSAP